MSNNFKEPLSPEQLSPKDKINDRLEKLNSKMNFDEISLFSYKVIEYTDMETDKERTAYKATFLGETLDVYCDSPQELIDILTLLEKIISIYKKENLNYTKGEKFYTKTWTVGTDKNDLKIDNRPFEIFDTTFLSQEALGQLLNEDENRIINMYMDNFADFLNKIIKII